MGCVVGEFPSGSSVGTFYIVNTAGTVDGEAFNVNDWLIPLVDSASTSTFAANWTRGNYSNIVPIGIAKMIFGSVASMLASNNFGYDAVDSPAVIVTAGDQIFADGHRYIVAASGATDHHLTNASTTPVKLYVVPEASGWINVKAFGALGDGATNDMTAIQAAVTFGPTTDAVGIWFPAGTYAVSSTSTWIMLPDNPLPMRGAGIALTKILKLPGALDVWAIFGHTQTAGPVYNTIDGLQIYDMTLEGNGDVAELSADAGQGLVHLYHHLNTRIERVRLTRSRGYGVGWQGHENSAYASQKTPCQNGKMIDCIVDNNGLAAWNSAGTDSDGVDLKAGDDVSFIRTRFNNNGDKGLDMRASKAHVEDCRAEGNANTGFSSSHNGTDASGVLGEANHLYLNCIAKDNVAGAGFNMTVNMTSGATSGKVHITYQSCYAENNTHNWAKASQGGADLNPCYCKLIDCKGLDPVTGTRQMNAASEFEVFEVIGGEFDGGTTGLFSLFASMTGEWAFRGVTMRNSTIAITGPTDTSARGKILDCTFDTMSSVAIVAQSNNIIRNNHYISVSGSGLMQLNGTDNRVHDDVGPRNISAASTIALPEITDQFVVIGTTTITALSVGYAGRVVSLRFANTVTVTDGSNLKLAGNFSATADDVMVLESNGANWYERSRSSN